MYASAVQPTLGTRILSSILYFLRAISPFHGSKGTHYPSVDHLEYKRRVFFAPRLASEKLLNMLSTNRDFAAALPQNTNEYLIIASICDDQLRANLYRIEADPSLAPIYDSHWHDSGYFNYHLTVNRTITPIIRESIGRYYDPDVVVMSFSQTLPLEELILIDRMRRHAV